MAETIDGLPGGTPHSLSSEDRYPSELAGADHAQQVFLHGCGLPAAWANQPRWCILETGFGLGLNFLLAWQAWRADPERPRSLHFVSTEACPVAPQDLVEASRAYPELMVLAQALSQQFSGLLPGVHRLSFEGGQVLLTLCIGEAPLKHQSKDQHWRADSVFLDGFNPARNPNSCDMYTLKAVARCCRRGTRLATWTAARSLTDAMSQCGFEVRTTPSLRPQRDPLQARFDPAWEPKPSRQAQPAAAAKPGHCLVIGAGLAGAATAASLARRGWQVTVLDAGSAVAAGASGLPAGLLAPHTSPDDSHLSRLSRSGLRATWQVADEHLTAGRDYGQTGVLQRRLPDDRDSRDSAGDLPADWPSSGQHWSQRATPEQLAQIQPGSQAPGLWHAAGGWIRPARLVQALLAQPDIKTQLNASVARLEQSAGGWRAIDANGQALAEANMVVLAGGVASAALAQPWAAGLPLQAIRGQVSWGLGAGATLPAFPVNGHGSFVPAFPAGDLEQSCWLLGATFDRNQTQTDLRPADQRANLARLETLLPDTATSLRARFESGQVQAWAGVRCASPDRLPLVGPVNEALAPGLWACTALGSRGLTFAVLCGELLAAWLHAEPLPLEPRLAQALRADRFKGRTKLEE